MKICITHGEHGIFHFTGLLFFRAYDGGKKVAKLLLAFIFLFIHIHHHSSSVIGGTVHIESKYDKL